jgi:hypothetical protein
MGKVGKGECIRAQEKKKERILKHFAQKHRITYSITTKEIACC